MSNTKDTPMDSKQFEGATPGPWKKVRDDSGWTIFAPNMVSTYDSRTKIICVLPNHEMDANLIAAAPDILKENQELKLELQKQKQEIANHIAVNSLLTDSEGEADLANKLYQCQGELQKQKELKAELVKSAIDEFVKLDYRSYTLAEIKLVLYSLIKKSN